MRSLRSPDDVGSLNDVATRSYLAERFEGMVEAGETYSPETHGWFAVVEEGDDVGALLEEADAFNPLHDLSGHRFGDEGFSPIFEWIADHGGFFEIVILLSDGGDFVGIVVPKLPGVDRALISLCEAYAGKEQECL